MHNDTVMNVYTVGGGMDSSITSGSPIFTGTTVAVQAVHDIIVGIAYNVPDDVGVTLTWGLQRSADASTWDSVLETTTTTTLVANGAGFTNIYGRIQNIGKHFSHAGAFIFGRILGTVGNFTDDTVQIYSWWNMVRNPGAVMDEPSLVGDLQFDVD